jgi:quercetin dioxygenase-like cupin family protein
MFMGTGMEVSGGRAAHVIGPGEGRVIVAAGARVNLKLTAAETGGACAVVEIGLPPHFAGQAPWVHRQTTALIYVVRGELACTVGQETRLLPAGGMLFVPPGTAYRCWNPTAAGVTYLAHLAPAGPERYWGELAERAALTPVWPSTDLSELHTLGQRYDLFPAK